MHLGCTGFAYGHVIDELEDLPRIDAETAIAQARTTLAGKGVKPLT